MTIKIKNKKNLKLDLSNPIRRYAKNDNKNIINKGRRSIDSYHSNNIVIRSRKHGLKKVCT